MDGKEIRTVLMAGSHDLSWSEALRRRGFQPVSEESIDLAIRQIEMRRFDLCALRVSGMEAIGFCRSVRSIAGGAVLPLIVVGDEGGSIENEREAFDVGADAFVGSERDGESFVNEVEALLNRVDSLMSEILPDEDRGYSKISERGLRLSGVERSSGDLSADNLWSLLISAYVDKRTGALAIYDRGNTARRLYVAQGELVTATSTSRDDRLVEILYREGRLDEEQYKKASLTVGSSGRRVGAILVEYGFIGSRELFPVVRHHYETIIFDSFSWREGSWQWEEGASPVGERILMEVPTPALIVEGIRSRARPNDIDSLVPRGSMPVVVPNGICTIEETGLLPEEIAIYNACDGKTGAVELAEKLDLTDKELRGMLAGLAALGLLRASFEGSEPDREDRGAGMRFVERDDYESERIRIDDKIATVEDGTYFSVLEVSNDASGYEIRKAYRMLCRQFAPERFGAPESGDMGGKVRMIRQVIDEAYEVLRDPAVREMYRQAVEQEL